MKETPFPPHKSSLGINANVLALIIYILLIFTSWLSFTKYLTWIIPLVFFIVERNSKFIKFYAVQGFFVGLIRAAFAGLFSLIDGALARDAAELAAMKTVDKDRIVGARNLASDIDGIIGIVIIVVIIYLAIMAYSYIQRELPGIGFIARKVSKIEEDDAQ